MQLVSIESKKDILGNTISQDGVAVHEKQTRYLDDDSDGELVNTVVQHFFDSAGLPVLNANDMFRCACGNILRREFGFYCPDCGSLHCSRHLAKPLTGRGEQTVRAHGRVNDQNSHNPSISWGICRSCFYRKEVPRILLRSLSGLVCFLAQLIIKPLRSIHADIPEQIPQNRPVLHYPSPRRASGLQWHARNTLVVLFAFALICSNALARTIRGPQVFFAKPTLEQTRQELEMRNSRDAVSFREVVQLREAACRLGLDQRQISPAGFALCRQIDREVAQGLVSPSAHVRLRRLVAVKASGKDEQLFSLQSPTHADGICAGQFSILRTLLTKIPVAFTKALLKRGVQHFSNTGQGKSTFLRELAQAWATLKLPCLVIASKPDQFFWYLARCFKSRTAILRVGFDRFYNAFSSVSGRALDFAARKLQYWQAVFNRWDSAALVTPALRQFDEQRANPNVRCPAPTLGYLYDAILRTRLSSSHVKPSLKPSCLAIFSQMQHGPLGVTMDCGSLDLRSVLLNRLILVMDCASLNDADTHFFVSCLLHDLRQTKALYPHLPDVLVVIDEAASLISRRWDSSSGSRASPMAGESVLLRSADIALALGYHSVSDVSSIVRANSATTLAGALGHGADVVAAGDAVGLTRAEALQILGCLHPGQAVIRIIGGAYTRPFFATWEPPMDFEPFTEEERQEQNKRVLAKLPPIVPGDVRQPVSFSSTPTTTQAENANDTIDTLILRDLDERPFLNESERVNDTEDTSLHGMPAKEFRERLEALKSQGFCDFVFIRRKVRGGQNSKMWFLTEEGQRTIGVCDKPKRGGTSLKHYFVQKLICHILSQRGIQARIEAVT